MSSLPPPNTAARGPRAPEARSRLLRLSPRRLAAAALLSALLLTGLAVGTWVWDADYRAARHELGALTLAADPTNLVDSGFAACCIDPIAMSEWRGEFQSCSEIFPSVERARKAIGHRPPVLDTLVAVLVALGYNPGPSRDKIDAHRLACPAWSVATSEESLGALATRAASARPPHAPAVWTRYLAARWTEDLGATLEALGDVNALAAHLDHEAPAEATFLRATLAGALAELQPDFCGLSPEVPEGCRTAAHGLDREALLTTLKDHLGQAPPAAWSEVIACATARSCEQAAAARWSLGHATVPVDEVAAPILAALGPQRMENVMLRPTVTWSLRGLARRDPEAFARAGGALLRQWRTEEDQPPFKDALSMQLDSVRYLSAMLIVAQVVVEQERAPADTRQYACDLIQAFRDRPASSEATRLNWKITLPLCRPNITDDELNRLLAEED